MNCKSFIALLTMLITASGLFAQVGGRITGSVRDPSGASVAGAVIAAINTTTGTKVETKADGQGVFAFPALAVGQYNIEISAPGFTPSRKTGVTIDVNSALQEDVTLQLAGQSTTVDVNEETEQVQVEKSDTELGQTITTQKIEELPLNGRSYTDLLAVQTGVAPITTSATSSTSSGGGFGAIAPSGGLNPGAPSAIFLNFRSVELCGLFRVSGVPGRSSPPPPDRRSAPPVIAWVPGTRPAVRPRPRRAANGRRAPEPSGELG
jgi:hypothetical protein